MIKHFYANRSGVTSIEFAIVIVPFLLVLLFLIELCRFIALSAVFDLSVAEAGRLVSRQRLNNETYLSLFNKKIHDSNSTFMWLFFDEVTKNDINIHITYCENLSDISANLCNNDSSKKIAIYNINYLGANSIFAVGLKYFSGTELSSSLVYVQEH
ncbi:tight adherence protein E [Orbus hercynius]|uniref:Tight adherence protein E n=1 Tax=Orbus hercynius TaxID=593135 RepID=A0A495RLP3_9GAMM|nr:TadE/TadG family type IV pilus assembly protein [Orbus hercynius]RKS87728.1 tight adherence protein E [Orbus hercynius]